MKPDLRTSPGKDTRVPQVPSPTSAIDVNPGPPSTASPGDGAPDMETQLHALVAQRAAIEEQEIRLRQSLFDLNNRIIAEKVASSINLGFDPATILKAHPVLCAATKPAKPQPFSSAKATTSKKGPSTYEGWITTFLNAGLRAYTAKHGVPQDQIPPDALAAIQEEAKRKAAAKCPVQTPVETEALK
jgi:hypothetical protein